MASITSTAELKQEIATLQLKRDTEALALKQSIKVTFDNLKPVNIIKRVVHDITASPELKEDILDSTIGMVAGYLSKKILVGSSNNPFKKIVGSVAQYSITNIVATHLDTIKAVGGILFKKFFKK